MLAKLLHAGYPSLVGLLLGLLQTGLFFQLSFTFSSSFGTFLMITLCWLLGSALGVLFLARSRWKLSLVLLQSLVSYALCGVLLNLAPFNTQLWPVYAALILLIGIYPGVFFGRMISVYPGRILFFRENNGFVLGLVLGTILFMFIGRLALWVGPLTIASLIVYADYYHQTYSVQMSY